MMKGKGFVTSYNTYLIEWLNVRSHSDLLSHFLLIQITWHTLLYFTFLRKSRATILIIIVLYFLLKIEDKRTRILIFSVDL